MDIELEFDTGQLNKVLNKLPKEIKKKVTRQAVAAGARVIRNKARELAPYDNSRTTGVHLRDAIIVQRVKGTNDIHVIGTKSRGRKAAPHAHLLEFGTVKMPPQPFLRPAYDQAKVEAIAKLFNTMANGILREAKKLAK